MGVNLLRWPMAYMYRFSGLEWEWIKYNSTFGDDNINIFDYHVPKNKKNCDAMFAINAKELNPYVMLSPYN